jgi:hypothetical protein
VVVCAVAGRDRVSAGRVVDAVDAAARSLDGVARFALAVVCVVAGLNPSRHASAPPSESIAATLNAVAALRARAARGFRRRRRGGVGNGAGLPLGSSMSRNVRTCGERPVKGG